jgi:hypothetical protein
MEPDEHHCFFGGILVHQNHDVPDQCPAGGRVVEEFFFVVIAKEKGGEDLGNGTGKNTAFVCR